MKTIQHFAKKHTIVYCILLEIVVTASIMIMSMLIAYIPGVVEMDIFVLQSMSELVGAIVVFAAMWLSGCTYVLFRKGTGFFKGLLVGGYFLVLSMLSASSLFAVYSGERILRPWYLIAAYLICMILVGITEEWMYRGIHSELLLRHFGATRKGVWKATILSGLLFGMAHLSNLLGAEPVGVLVQCVVASGMGMVFAAVFYRTGNIWVPVFLHALVDAAALITSGLYDGKLTEIISEYRPVQVFAVIPYFIVLVVLFRKKKMAQILERLSEEGAVPAVE